MPKSLAEKLLSEGLAELLEDEDDEIFLYTDAIEEAEEIIREAMLSANLSTEIR